MFSTWSAFAACFHLKIHLHNLSPLSSCFSLSLLSGLRKGNEIRSLNGEAVSDLDLKQMEALFSEKSVGLTLVARPAGTRASLCTSCSDSDLFSRDQKSLLPSPNQCQLLEEFLDNFKKTSTNGKAVFRVGLDLLVRWPMLLGCSFDGKPRWYELLWYSECFLTY